CPCRSPFVFAVPRETLAKCFGDAPPVRIPEPRQHRARRRHPEHVDELLPEQPERDRVEQEHALAGEGDDSTLWEKVQQLVNIEIGRAHQASENNVKLRVNPIILIIFLTWLNLPSHVSD